MSSPYPRLAPALARILVLAATLGPVSFASSEDLAYSEQSPTGITVELLSTSDLLRKARGGVDPAAPGTGYRSRLDVSLTLDTDRLGLWPGGIVFLDAQSGQGGGLTQRHVGDTQVLSNIDAHRFTQLSEWWLEQAFLSDRLRLKLGRQDANADFACFDSGAFFLNSSFGLIPTVPIPTFPEPAVGVTASMDLSPRFNIALGAFDPALARVSAYPAPASFGIELRLASGAGGENRYRVGLWHVRPYPFEASGLHPPTGAWAIHGTLDKTLVATGDGRGLRVFAQVGLAPAITAGVDAYLGWGAVHTGLGAGRDQDSIGLGVAHARLARPQGPVGGSETAIELFYRVRVLPWLIMQPDIQYIVSPSGLYEDAFIAGLRVETRF